jgi:hypothetical protein
MDENESKAEEAKKEIERVGARMDAMVVSHIQDHKEVVGDLEGLRDTLLDTMNSSNNVKLKAYLLRQLQATHILIKTFKSAVESLERMKRAHEESFGK